MSKTVEFSSGTTGHRRKCNDIIKVLGRNKLVDSGFFIYYRISGRNTSERKAFSNEGKVEELVVNRSTLKKFYRKFFRVIEVRQQRNLEDEE